MEEAKFNNLCSHYKDTFDIQRETLKQRDMLFYGLLIILAFFTLQLSSSDLVANIVHDYMNKFAGIKLSKGVGFISTMLWFLLLGFTTKYFQVVLEIERQYKYLHALEEELNKFYTGTKIFTREGKSYLNPYPLFLSWTRMLYTVLVPFLIIFVTVIRIYSEIANMETIGANQMINFTCYLFVGTSSILYAYRLHEPEIQKFIRRLSALATKSGS